MKKILYLLFIYIYTNISYAQESQIEIEKLGKSSLSEWEITDAFGQKIISSKELGEQVFNVVTLDANTRYYFNINIEQLSKKDTSLYLIKLNKSPIILINTTLEIGDHSYPFYTGQKSPVLKVIGGSNASISDYPWQVFLTAGGYMCGGTIISEKWILTAAHCVIDENGNDIRAEWMNIKVGATIPSYDRLGKNYKVKNVIVHENYSVKNLEYDIAVLELFDSIDFENAEPIELISKDEAENGAVDPGTVATLTGWGLTRVNPDLHASILQKAELPIVSNSTAATVWGNIDPDILMAGYVNGGKDACSGDSGGPLTVDVDGTPKLVGIVSWGSENCNTYGGYTRVSSYEDWIYDNTGIPRPVRLSAPAGITSICNKENQYSYATNNIDAKNYEWELLPAEAGTLVFNGTESNITWNEDYYGKAQIKVRAELNDKLTSWSTRNVEVLELTNINYQEGDATICNQEKASFFISASGHELKYNWYKNGEFYQTTNSAYLNFDEADTNNTGIYYCNVEGSCGIQQSENIELIVHPTTEIYSTPLDQYLLLNSDTTIKIPSNGHELKYQWYKDGTPIYEKGDMSYLELNSVNAADIGQYQLQIEGTCGSEISELIYVYVDMNEFSGISANVWPSVTNGWVNIAISNTNPYSIKIYNLSGQILYSNEEAAVQTSVDVSTWDDGLYIVKIKSDGLDETVRIIKY